MITVIFFDELPTEFDIYITSCINALTGGWSMLFVGAYSILSDITTEENRTFRFTLFWQIVSIIPIMVLPFGGYFLSSLGYLSKYLIPS